MRTLFSLLVAPMVLAAAGSAFANDSAPQLVKTPISKVFVPTGFDDNDNSEIILHGEFPNSCYKLGPATASVDIAARKIIVDANAYVYRGTGCAQMMVPFIQPLSLGLVPAGSYSIVVKGSPNAEAQPLSIAISSTRDADDFLYAPVDYVSVERGTSGENQVVIEGQYPMMFVGCMKIVELRKQVTKGQVIMVQPIAQIFTEDDECVDQPANKRYHMTQSLPEITNPDEYLAHVRSLAGQSLNRLVDLRH